jgi:hypothetical protein
MSASSANFSIKRRGRYSGSLSFPFCLIPEAVSKLQVFSVYRTPVYLLRGASFGDNRREFPSFFLRKRNGSVGQGKQGIVAAAAYIGAGVYAGSPLAYDDGTGPDPGSPGRFDPKIMGI